MSDGNTTNSKHGFIAHFNTTNLTEIYQLEDNVTPITFDLIIHPAELDAVSSIKLDRKVLHSPQTGSLTGITVGTKSELTGKTLNIFTVISNINKLHSPTIITLDFLLTGGINPYRNKLEKITSISEDSVSFSILISFH